MTTAVRMPDNPKPISLFMLRELDADPPGTWMASPKLDGYRRVLHHVDGQWTTIAKHAGPAAKPFDAELQAEFDSITWPKGLGLDCEFMGPRHAGMPHSLHLFDMLYYEGNWIGDIPFSHRLDMLQIHVAPLLAQCKRIKLIPYSCNPGLESLFAMQLQDPKSEGLVVRRFDSKLVGKVGACADNNFIFKVKFKTDVKGGMA